MKATGLGALAVIAGLLLLAVPAGAVGVPTITSSATVQGNSVNTVTTPTFQSAMGDQIIVAIGGSGSPSVNIQSITDSFGSTFAAAAPPATGPLAAPVMNVYLGVSKSPTTPATTSDAVTVTLGGSSTFQVAVIDVTGSSTSAFNDPITFTGGGLFAGTQSPATASATPPSNAPSLMVAFVLTTGQTTIQPTGSASALNTVGGSSSTMESMSQVDPSGASATVSALITPPQSLWVMGLITVPGQNIAAGGLSTTAWVSVGVGVVLVILGVILGIYGPKGSWPFILLILALFGAGIILILLVVAGIIH